MNQGLRVSIVIPIYQQPKLQNTLLALTRQTAFARIQEVLLAGQMDAVQVDAVTEIPGLPCRYLPVDPPTIPNNRNRGIEAASCYWICMLDADCVPQAGWLEGLLRAVETGQAQAYAGAVDLPPDSGYWSHCDHLAGFPLQAVGLIQPCGMPYAASLNLCLRRDVFDQLGGFDPELLSSEDRDFCERLRTAGFRIQGVPEAVVLHDHNRDSFQAAADHIRSYGRWTMRFRWKHRAAASRAKRLYWDVLKIPGAGHLLAFAQSLFRLVSRLFFQPSYRRFWAYLPGIALLEYHFVLGMKETRASYGD